MLVIRIFFLFPLIVASFMPVHSSGQNHPDKFLKTIEEKAYYYPQQAETMLDSLMSIDSLQIKKDQPGELAFLRGFLAYHKGDSDKALNYLDTALLTFIRNESSDGQAKCHLLMGWITEADKFHEQAVIYFYETIRLLNVQPSANAGLAYLGIARCKKILNEPFETELDKGLEYLRSTGKTEFLLYAKFTSNTLDMDGQGSENRLLEITDQYKALGLSNNVSTVYKVLANHYYVKHQLDSAHFYVDKAILSYDNSYPGESLIPALHQMKGLFYSGQKNFVQAREEYELALKLYEISGQVARSTFAYNSLYHLDFREGNYKSATENLSKVLELEKVSGLKEKQRMAKLLEITSGINQLNQEIAKVKKQKRLMLFTILFLGAIMTILIISALNFLRVRALKKRMINAEFQILLSSNFEKELALQHLNKIKANTLTIHEAQSLPNIEDRYPRLFGLVSRTTGPLSHSERIFAFMLAIGHSNEAIAAYFNVEPSSLRKTRQRIREKLKLEKGIELRCYFQNLIKL
jgi:tetratricopeptide (TPR) repeat protein/DNA-binding CsgD family transcriptional regulator